MKIKLDENLPDRLVAVLTGLGHNVDTVRTEQLTGRADPDVWSAAQAAQRFLITQDLDFSDVRRYTPGTHAGLLLRAIPRQHVRRGAGPLLRVTGSLFASARAVTLHEGPGEESPRAVHACCRRTHVVPR